MLHPTGTSRERILLMGPWGAGKSYAWIKVAQWIASTKAESQMFVMDTDLAWERMCEGWEAPHVHVTDATDWDSLSGGVNLAVTRAKRERHDWLVVDMADKMWDFAQSGFSEKAFGKRIDEWFIEAKRSGENVGGDYGSNWSVINRMYAQVIGQILRFPGHVLCCTPVEPVQSPDRQGKGGDSSEIRDLFGRFGVKPKGQKALGHQFHTIILLSDTGKGYRAQTVKERSMPGSETAREKLVGVSVTDFTKDYLMKIARWQP